MVFYIRKTPTHCDQLIELLTDLFNSPWLRLYWGLHSEYRNENLSNKVRSCSLPRLHRLAGNLVRKFLEIMIYLLTWTIRNLIISKTELIKTLEDFWQFKDWWMAVIWFLNQGFHGTYQNDDIHCHVPSERTDITS